MIKDQMQQIIDQQEQQIKEQTAKIQALESDDDGRIKASKLYKSLQYENQSLRDEVKFYKSLADSATAEKARMRNQMGARFDEKVRQILADNQELVSQHDASYWIGITRSSDAKYLRQLERDNDDLQNENTRLTDKLSRAEKQIRRLQNQYTKILYELHPEDMPELEPEEQSKPPVMGRPKTGSIGENIQARQYRKQGYSIREIADKMGWSVGLTQKTVASVQVDPEVVKQHRKENRKPRKKVRT